MIRDEHVGFFQAVRAIATAQPVDWEAVESNTEVSDSLAALMRQLKVIADIAELHRSLPDAPISSNDHARWSLSTAARIPANGEPRTWGALQLLERVGRGAFADVYRAWDPRLDRQIALKLLTRQESRPDSLGSVVVNEGRMLARIRHPNVVTVYGADRIDGQVGLWMEFVRGRTLESVLRDHGPFGAQEAGIIALDVLRALSAVHHAGLIHRDVKAQNVMREEGGRIVLMDLGAGLDDTADASADLAGTPLYQAPEVFRGDPATAQSDLYSVGVLLYHLVTAMYPVKGRTVGDLCDAHRSGSRSWLRDERPDLPADFIEAVECALDRDPAQRYESAGAMEARLTRVVLRSSATPHAPAVAVARESLLNSEDHKPRKWIMRAAFATSAIVMALILVLVPSAWRGRILDRLVSKPRPGADPALVSSPVVVRRISLEDFSFIGRPSPDGTLFSVADDAGNVAIIDLATGRARHVTTDATFSTRGSQFAGPTVISQDNGLVAYGWFALDGKYELRVADLEGQKPRVLLRSESFEQAEPLQWSHDGKSLLTTLVRPDHSTLLALVAVDEGTVRSVRELGMVSPQGASLSPDGEFIVYDAPQQKNVKTRDVFIVRRDGTDDRRLIEHPADDAQPVWSPDGDRVLFASDRSGAMDVWSVAVDGGVARGEPQVVHRSIGRMWLRGLTAAGSYFYFLTAGAVDVYEGRIVGGVVSNPVAISSYSGSNVSSVWSPDGQRLAYASRRGLSWFDRGSTTLAIRDAQSGQQLELLPSMRSFLVRSWSPDGRHVLVQGTGVDRRQGMYGIDSDNAGVTALMVDESTARPDWLSDGRIMYFSRPKQKIIARDLHTGAEQIVLDPRAEGGDLVADVGGRGYKLSPDGQTLAFTKSRRLGSVSVRTLMIKVLEGGPARELIHLAEPERLLFQIGLRDSAALLFTRSSGTQPESLWRVSIRGDDPQPMGLSMVGLRDVSVRSDGSRVTFTAGWPRNELWVMENVLADK